MSEHPNVASVTASMEALARGDIDGYFADYAPDFVWYGWTVDGDWVAEDPAMFRSQFKAIDTLFSEVRTELVTCEPVDDDLVVATTRLIRKTAERELDAVCINFYRFEDGKVTLGGSFQPKKVVDFYKKLQADRQTQQVPEGATASASAE